MGIREIRGQLGFGEGHSEGILNIGYQFVK